MPQPCSADLRERVLGPMSTEKVVRWRLLTAFAFVRPPSATEFGNPARTAGASPSRTTADPVVGWALLSFRCYRPSWLRPATRAWMTMRSACSRSPASGSAVR
jgi:hypothetical protein